MAVELNSDNKITHIRAGVARISAENSDTNTETVEDQDESTGSNSQSIQNS